MLNFNKQEEKQRHQRQYPGYRYQPRRSGKPNGVLPVSSSSTDNPGRCPKCGGQYISTPSTPITPFLGSFGGGGSRNERNERLPPPFTPMSSSRNTPIDRSRPLSQMHPQRVETPRKASAHQQNRLSPYPTQLLHTHHERDEDMDLVTPSPDQKRRRFNNESQRGFPPSSSPISISAPSNFSRNADPYLRNNAPIPVGEYQQQRLPGPSMLGRRGNLGASSSQSPMMQQRHPYPTRSNAFDDSLRLPPLQTQLQASTPSSNSRKDFRLDPRDVQAKSLEAVIMDIPYISKMKVLSKISPPLQQPGPASPAQETRGAVIAVESADKSLLIEVGGLIDYHIRKDNSCSIKSWATSSKRYSRLPTNDTETLDASPSTSMNLSSRTDPEEQDPFIQYLLVMSEWHEYSNEIVKHITTIPKTSPEEIPPTPAPSTGATEVLPIALLRDGFSITISDTYSIRIPISDSYAPIDHWQWMATLWRGIVGPDLVIYAKRVERDEYDRYGGVEIRNDCPAIIVRLLESGRMDEKTSRRLGFEVMEFIKTFEGGFGRC
jgi:HMG box factor